jgi:hypothetical protein
MILRYAALAQDQNGIARDQLIKLWSHAVCKEKSIKNSFIGVFLSQQLQYKI